eukprot:CAMPEP_0202977526 /NCGR_PEP_ID=MMETSP1396-20130829/84296_1 /ASSEMBLY_ACC=CAM_ASM_000872 /TAXON_ID= /ORGANISM="Pseudokeronopsis sp., Strain Brazil" /LENGTH=105 /DNA_ID=CAMNT_0049716277 /DNA_START=1822 /DNA_END=2139 /DNA_ORIENTATION=+
MERTLLNSNAGSAAQLRSGSAGEPRTSANLAIKSKWQALKIEEDVMKKVVERAKFEGIDKNPRLSDPNDRFFNNLRAFAIYKLSYYQCFKCKAPYFGGMKDCEAG